MQFRIARSARETSRTGSANPANLPREIRTRKLRTTNKMSVPLKPQQNTTPPSTNTRKIVSTTRKKTVKTPGSWIQKTPRMKLHRGTKANRCCRICQRDMTTMMMMMMTESLPKTTTAMKMATAPVAAELTRVPAPEEAPQNGWDS